ncbi:MAG: TVP38/TMEM64 family protein [Terricaulis sp.]
MSENKSASRRRTIAGLAVLGVVTLVGFAAPLLPPDLIEDLGPWLAQAKANSWAPLAAILGYTLFASIGAPQFVLITALVAVFGPWLGFAYSWTGKVLACTLGFALGRRFGARMLAAHSGPRLSEFMRQLARRGFLVSALIRMTPTVPSVLINIAAGATPIRFWDFFFGTALGSVPKMALFAFGGHAAMEALRNNSAWTWIVLAAAVAVWVLLAFFAREWMRRANTPAGER